MIAEETFTDRWIELDRRAVFRISGPDRVRFLNGQVSNDVAKDLSQESIAACLCSLKGKVEALVWVGELEDSLIVDGEITQRKQLYERLERYLIADDCEIADATGKLRLIHHFGSHLGGARSRRLCFPGTDLWIEELPSNLQPEGQISDNEFQVAQLMSLIPRAGYEITGAEFPAELGLDRWAVDFHKGCYLGQEIVSRIESVGRVKKQLRLLKASQIDEKGTEITNELGERGKITGKSLQLDEKTWVNLGLFEVSQERSQVANFQPVIYIRQ